MRAPNHHAKRSISVLTRFGYGLFLICLGFCAGCAPCPDSGGPISETDFKEVIRVACVGDSLTYGAGLENRERDAYPSQLQGLLGTRWDVRNFGCPGTTALQASRGTKAGLPYCDQGPYHAALQFMPHAVVLQFGTNDADPALWEAHKEEFKDDYRSLLRHFASLPTKPRIWLCFPTPLAPKDKNVRLDNLRDEVIPCIQSLAEEEQQPVIDFFKRLHGRWELFPDQAHPDARGARMLAEEVFQALTGKPVPHSEGDEP
ncbi:MAG: GDSL-type esterase/lipase family protein [Planctomycetota bacterium]